MSDDEADDLDGMWDELENDEGEDRIQANISGNLTEDAGKTAQEVHEGDVDEGRLMWVPPESHGLHNSDKVTVSGTHWNREDQSHSAATLLEQAIAADAAQAAVYNQIKVDTPVGSLYYTPPDTSYATPADGGNLLAAAGFSFQSASGGLW